jgi:uncharacterized membrane protein YdfJ with MMPL/SSD domain
MHEHGAGVQAEYVAVPVSALPAGDADESENSLVKDYYFPFLQRYNKYILVMWLAVFAVSVAFGPQFLSLTSSDVSLPSNLPSVEAISVYNDNYPDASGVPPMFVLYHSDNGADIISAATKALSQDLSDSFASTSYLADIAGYWQYVNNSALSALKSSFVSLDNTTMVTTLIFDKSAKDTQLDHCAKKLLKFSKDHTSSDVFVGTTGLFPLFSEMQEATATDFEMIDSTVLPIGLVLLGFTIKSYKHVLLALCNLLITVIFAFALLVPVAKAESINPFSPTIMMSLGIAVCFDYSLFQLNRFKEELVERKRSTERGVINMLETSGHVIGFSSFILFLTFCILIIFPQQFLRSIGISCCCVVFCACFVNLTLTPSFLLAFPWFSSFQMFPGVSDETVLRTLHIDYSSAKVEDMNASSNGGGKATNANAKAKSDADAKVDPVNNTEADPEVGRATNASIGSTSISGDKAVTMMKTPLRSRQRSFWFQFVLFVVNFRVVFLTVTAVITALLLWQVLTMVRRKQLFSAMGLHLMLFVCVYRLRRLIID